jgi:ADP-heptose:LPS heptosyltransferase
MQEVVSFLQKGHQIFLFGQGEKEKEKFNIWEKAYPNVYSTEMLISLEEQLDLMSNLDLMISMDSANGHLAANFGIPVLTLWGLTHPFCGFTPFGQSIKNSLYLDRTKYPRIPTSIYGKKVPRGYQKAFRSLKPKGIIEKALEILSQENN